MYQMCGFMRENSAVQKRQTNSCIFDIHHNGVIPWISGGLPIAMAVQPGICISFEWHQSADTAAISFMSGVMIHIRDAGAPPYAGTISRSDSFGIQDQRTYLRQEPYVVYVKYAYVNFTYGHP